MDNLNRFSGDGEKDGSKEKEPVESSEETKFTIDEVVLRNVTVDTTGLIPGDKGDSPPLHFEEISLSDIGTETKGGMVASQLMDKILVAVLAASAEHGVDAISSVINDSLGGKIDLKAVSADLGVEGISSIGEVGDKVLKDVSKEVGNELKKMGVLFGTEKKDGEKK